MGDGKLSRWKRLPLPEGDLPRRCRPAACARVRVRGFCRGGVVCAERLCRERYMTMATRSSSACMHSWVQVILSMWRAASMTLFESTP